LLRNHGFDVEIAASGPDVLALADAQDRGVILLDIGLPGMTGRDVTRCLKARETVKKPFIIALTGYGQEADRLRSVDAGIDFHLTKPVDPTTLDQILSRFERIVA
jgi:DNA-binding response OmpR family regulator